MHKYVADDLNNDNNNYNNTDNNYNAFSAVLCG